LDLAVPINGLVNKPIDKAKSTLLGWTFFLPLFYSSSPLGFEVFTKCCMVGFAILKDGNGSHHNASGYNAGSHGGTVTQPGA
jgi:hypothetical protein